MPPSVRRSRNEESRKSEEYYRALIENALDLITVIDAGGVVQYVSPSIEQVLGYKPEERIGKSTFQIIHRGDLPHVREALARGAQTRQAIAHVVFRIRHKDRSWRHLEAAARNLLDNPDVAGIVVNSRDITGRIRAEEKIHASEEWFRSSFEYAGAPTAITSTGGRFLQVNPAMCRFLGLSEQELLGTSWAGITHPGDIRASRSALRRLLAGEAPSIQLEKRYLHKSGRDLWGYVTLSLIRDAEGRPVRIAAQIVDITRRKEMEAALRQREAELLASQKDLRSLAGRLMNGEEDQRRWLARELHDDFNQRLTAAGFELAELEEGYAKSVPARLKKKLRGVRDRVAELSEDLRRVAHQLHPATIELLGLPAALSQLCLEASHPGRIHARFSGRKLPERFPDDVALCFYRVAQECLQNILKHSQADRVWVTLSGTPKGLRLSIRDNGIGFDTARVEAGLGLLSMKERLRLVGGTLSIDSNPGEGTRVTVEAPLRDTG